jgi:MoxR-like ATPase
MTGIDHIQIVFERVRNEVARALVGQEDIVEQALLAILARGHVLLEGVPGLGKTLLVRALGAVLGADYRRIQFTPDLMPSDVTGSNVFNQKKSEFEFSPGPIFTQLLLADEINRAPAKTQSALLEAMQERSVTTDGVTRPLPAPFFVIATQNPVESQGTYPLPEAQLDRFLFKLTIHHPSVEVEKAILVNHLRGFDAADLGSHGLQRILTAAELLELQRALAAVQVEDSVLGYITELVARSRKHRAIYLGASPRASVALLLASRARAATQGRDFVVPDDVKALAGPVLRHRLILHPDSELEGVSADDCVAEILRDVTVPRSATAAA